MTILHILIIPGFFFLFFLLVLLELLLFGSSVDPDDNGLVRTPAQKEKYKQKKLEKMEKYSVN